MKFPYRVQKKAGRTFKLLREFRTQGAANAFIGRLRNRFKRNVYRVNEEDL